MSAVRGETRKKTVSRKEAEKCQFILALFTSDSSGRDKGKSTAIAKQGHKGVTRTALDESESPLIRAKDRSTTRRSSF